MVSAERILAETDCYAPEGSVHTNVCLGTIFHNVFTF